MTFPISAAPVGKWRIYPFTLETSLHVLHHVLLMQILRSADMEIDFKMRGLHRDHGYDTRSMSAPDTCLVSKTTAYCGDKNLWETIYWGTSSNADV